MKRIHIVGRKNSGKTTLIVELEIGTAIWRRGDLDTIVANIEQIIEPAKVQEKSWT